MAKILIVEDEKRMQSIIVEYMQKGGYTCITADDGVEALTILKSNNIDLMILDIMMPYLDGFSVCRVSREMTNIPIIILTAKGEEEDKLKGYEYGADDYITKPFSFNLLIKRVEAILRRSNKTINDKFIVFEKLKLDLNTYIAEIDGEPIELTLKEFNILKALIEKYPQVITREGLLDSIWGYDYYGDTRIVDAHIKNIRKKISLPYIKTVKGIGYTLEKDI